MTAAGSPKPEVEYSPARSKIVLLKPHAIGDEAELLQDLRAYEVAQGEEYMSTRQKDYFHQLLSHWLKQIDRAGRRAAAALKSGLLDQADENDRASSEEQLALNLRWHERESRLSQKLKDTVARIDSEEFGYCDICEVEIGLERMLARPTATLCIDCKQIEELKERQGV